jgi:hypothetical protein
MPQAWTYSIISLERGFTRYNNTKKGGGFSLKAPPMCLIKNKIGVIIFTTQLIKNPRPASGEGLAGNLSRFRSFVFDLPIFDGLDIRNFFPA